MKRNLSRAPHASASFLSLASRLPLWEWLLSDDPATLKTLAKCMESLYNADNAAEILRISNHPDIQECLQTNTVVTEHGVRRWLSKGREHDKHLKRVVYHLDFVSRYRAASLGDDSQQPPPPSHHRDTQPSSGPQSASNNGDEAPAGAPSPAPPAAQHHAARASRASAASSSAPPLGAPASSSSTAVASISSATAPSTSGVQCSPALAHNTAPRVAASLAHFRQMFTETKAESYWFSVQKPGTTTVFSDVLASEPPMAGDADDDDDDADIEFEDDAIGLAMHDPRLDVPLAERRSNHAFFHVTCSNVAQWKHVKGDTDSASLSSCVLVRRHYVTTLPRDGKIEIAAMPAVFFSREGYMDTIQVLDGVDLSGVMAWSEGEGALSALPSDLPESMDQAAANGVLSKFILAGAWPNSCQYLVVGSEAFFGSLVDAGPRWRGENENRRERIGASRGSLCRQTWVSVSDTLPIVSVTEIFWPMLCLQYGDSLAEAFVPRGISIVAYGGSRREVSDPNCHRRYPRQKLHMVFDRRRMLRWPSEPSLDSGCL